ncbi:hypothetical protein [Kribbella sp. NPDC051620]|uniref:hypothetical protein n=1 Tax=Kribbella sp. NPDC051620 TaxID=3364120 RepID=UPI00378AAFF1
MPKLTDEEVGQLLRETFTEKEELLDHLPEATIRPVRRKAPVLLAAAAVLVVLAGVLSVAGLDGGPPPGPTAGKTPSSAGAPAAAVVPSNLATVQTGEVGNPDLTPNLTAIALAELTKWERPAGGWPVVKVLDASYPEASSPTGGQGGSTPFTAEKQAVITTYAKAFKVPISWVKSRPTGDQVCEQADGTPYVTLGPVVMDKSGSSATIGMSMWRGCLDAQWLTYKLVRIPPKGGQENSGPWRVAGTVGPVAES